ncbi:MAG: pilus assembly protein [Chromatiaceae bacterium]|nr:pilus assembly protein [Chromatiaceae bacterium]
MVVIIAILAAIAFAYYQNHMLTVRRVEAQGIMLNIQGLQEQHLLKYTLYESKLSDLGNFESDEYAFSINGATNTTYTITATAKGSQTDDTGCIFMTLNQAGLRCPGADPRCPTHTDCW